MRISAIVAIDEKRGMGKDGGIPWHIPGEQKRFKDITIPHPIIMGRKTFASIGRVLPGRPHIIVTRDSTWSFPDTTVVHSVHGAIEKGKELEELRVESVISNEVRNLSMDEIFPQGIRRDDNPEIFIIGGGEILREAMPFLDRLYLTIIEKDFECDTFFPEYRQFTKVLEKEEHTFEDITYTYLTLQK